MDDRSRSPDAVADDDRPPEPGSVHATAPAGETIPDRAPLIGRRAHPATAVLSLKQAMRRARFDDAERSGAMADLRAARIGRLEVLQDALKPLIAQIPSDVDYFDVAVMPGINPRLFIDMIGFVELGRDPRVYRFLQDTRHGRIQLAESESVDTVADAVTHYVARRLLERDKALASDDASTGGVPESLQSRAKVATAARVLAAKPVETPAKPRRSILTLTGLAFSFVIDVLGSVAFFSLIAFAGWILWSVFLHKP